jgi:hypothetical protein
MSEFTDQTMARKLEITFQGALIASLGHRNIYRANEEGERLLPCVVLKAESKEEDMAFRYQGRYALTLELRATAMVSAVLEDSSRALETDAQSLRQAIETATITTGYNYLRLEYAGDAKGSDGIKREFSHIWKVTAH